jgi:hypothetical protein
MLGAASIEVVAEDRQHAITPTTGASSRLVAWWRVGDLRPQKSDNHPGSG